ncbi:MAG: ATP-binding protein [Gammaproteobacteria bacterium]|nr:ATP-binding protein [Gammaproteobacteria bacterium]
MPGQFSSQVIRLITLPALVLVIVGFSIPGFYALNHQALLELGQESKNRLNLFVSNLNGTLAKFEHLPKLISTNRHLLTTLENSDNKQIHIGNRYLQSVVSASGASDAYLLNAEGLTIAASNWNLDRSFIGQNFSFRPYFTSAIKGEVGRYFALGTTSQKRGYYFSYPVFYDNVVAGVVVIKINLADIETAWSDRGNHFLVTDEDGIVFLSTHAQWIYKATRHISTKKMKEINQSRRYSGQEISPLNINRLTNLDGNISLVKVADNKNANYLHLSTNMPGAGWTVHSFSDTRSIRDTLILRAALATFGILIVLLLITLYLMNRQRRLALQGSTELLEKRVKKRTQELQNQIEERTKTEQTLRDTQAELIQAAKLAGLGQMSAGISHELNQPLTAIRNYAENSLRLLERNQPDSASSNLVEIGELTKRMASIISQLRGFSRKSGGERSRTSLEESVDQALGMFQREISSNHVVIKKHIEDDLSVITDPLLLNQVLVNLFSNAIQAMSGAEKHRIDIESRTLGNEILISISDTGTGIPEHVIENVFDPFFTTKEVGLGLGLGLSISYRIMESLGGRISATNIISGGACFELYLPNE